MNQKTDIASFQKANSTLGGVSRCPLPEHARPQPEWSLVSSVVPTRLIKEKAMKNSNRSERRYLQRTFETLGLFSLKKIYGVISI